MDIKREIEIKDEPRESKKDFTNDGQSIEQQNSGFKESQQGESSYPFIDVNGDLKIKDKPLNIKEDLKEIGEDDVEISGLDQSQTLNEDVCHGNKDDKLKMKNSLRNESQTFMSGPAPAKVDRPAPYTLPRRTRMEPHPFANLVSTVIKYKYIPVSPGSFLIENSKNANAIVSAMIDLIDPSLEIQEKFMKMVTLSNGTKIRDLDTTRIPQVSATPNDIKLRSFCTGFALTAHLGKPITQVNKAYIHKRLVAIGHGCNHLGLQTLTESSISGWIDLATFDAIRSNIPQSDAVIPLLKNALAIDTQGSAMMASVVTSFKMVFEGYGMTAVRHMEYFCSIVTRALLYKVVLDEAKEFKKRLDGFKARHGVNWQFGRLLQLPDIEELNASKYPHLYTCAIGRAKGPHGRGLGKFKESNFPLKESKQTLVTAANINILTK